MSRSGGRNRGGYGASSSGSGGGSRGGGGGGAQSGSHLLSFSYANSDRLLNAESDTRAERPRHHAASAAGGGSGGAHHRSDRFDPAQHDRAALIQKFQFIVGRSDLGHPLLRDALMCVDAPPPWEIVKFVVVRCPIDDFACPICLEPPVAAVASMTCGHVFCLKCVYSLAIHGWEAQRQKQLKAVAAANPSGKSPPPPPPQHQPTSHHGKGIGATPPSFIDGLTERTLGQYIRAGCPMCHKPMSLRELVPAVHVPVAAVRGGDRITLVPVRATLPMPLAVFGTSGAECCRINVEADETFAWATQQAIELGDEAEAALSGIAVAEANVETAIAVEAARLAEEEESRPEHMKSGNTAAGLFASTRMARLQLNECDAVKEARCGVVAARIEAESVRLAQQFWVAFVEATGDDSDGGGPLTHADLDVFARYGAQVAPTTPGSPMRPPSASTGGDFGPRPPSATMSASRQSSSAALGSGAPPSGGGGGVRAPMTTVGEPSNDHWAFRAGSGAPIFLHPLATRMIIESALERKGYAVAPPVLPPPPANGAEDTAADEFNRASSFSVASSRGSRHAPAAPPPPLLTVADLPASITIRVGDVEEVEQSRQGRAHAKSLSLVPLGGRYGLVFPDAVPDGVSKAVRLAHRRLFDARARKRSDKARRETTDEVRAREREEEKNRKRNSSDPGRHVHSIPSAQFFDQYGDSVYADVTDLPPDLTESPPAAPTSPPAGPAGGGGGPFGHSSAWAPKTRNILAEDHSAEDLPSSSSPGPLKVAAAAASSPGVGVAGPAKGGSANAWARAKAQQEGADTKAPLRAKEDPWGTKPPATSGRRPPTAQ